MAYTAVPSVVTGQTYPASSYNTYIKGNFDAMWLYTTAGDIVYATSPTALARLGLGSAGQVLRVNDAGNAPIWGYQATRYCSLGLSAGYSVNNGGTTIAWDVEYLDPGWHNAGGSRITPGSGTFIPSAYIEVDNPSAVQYVQAQIMFNGVYQVAAGRAYSNGGYLHQFCILGRPFAIGPSDYFTVLVTTSSATLTLQTTSWFSAMEIKV